LRRLIHHGCHMRYINKAVRAVRKLLRDLAIDAAFVGILWLAHIR